MKKLLILAAVFVIVACPLFAAAATKAAVPAPVESSKMTTVTKELSTGSYPGVLVPGSISGLASYMSDLSLLPNTALFEYVDGDTMGLIVLKTDFGTIGAAIAPASIDALNNIHMFIPQDVLSVMYAAKLGSMPFGAALSYSTQKFDYENKDLSGYVPPGNRDFRNNYDQYLSVKAGTGMGGLDLGAAITLLTNSRKTSYWAGPNWSYDNIVMTNTWQVDLSGRTELFAGITGSAVISWLTAQDEQKYLDNGNDYVNRWNNSMLSLSIEAGKSLKVMDSLNVKMAAGLKVGGNTNGIYRYIDNLDPTNSYLGFNGSGEGDRTQYGYWYIPLNVAVEAKLNDTWTVNSGIQATIVGFNNTQSMYNTSALLDKEKLADLYGSASVSISPGLDYAIGLTGKIGDLSIDIMLNPQIFLNGPYFISGNAIGGLNSSVALHYDW